MSLFPRVAADVDLTSPDRPDPYPPSTRVGDVFVKICGITNEDDALFAVAMGADAVGFVFAPSGRQVSAGTAREIVRRLPEEVLTVGVFRDQSVQQVIHIAQEARLNAVQLHGHETPEQADEIRPYVSALIVAFAAGDPMLARVDEFGADAVLIDSHSPGSGKVFDWSLAEGAPSNRRLILAGGLTPENVPVGISEVKPWGVDVSSGVELEGHVGRKDPLKVKSFIARAKKAGAAVVGDPATGQASTGSERKGAFDWSDFGL